MDANQSAQRLTARQQRKRAEKKKKLERRQNKATRKAMRYTMPKNTEIMQANLVSTPQISRAFVNSSLSKTINMLNNVNSDLVRRDATDRQEATKIGEKLLLSMIKANRETTSINESAIRTAITNTKDEIDKSVDGLIAALAEAKGNEIKSAAESVKQMVEALRNSQIENDQQRLMLNSKSAEFDKQRELDARAAADEMADKIKEAFGQIKDTFSQGAAGLNSALDSLADASLNLHNLINSAQFNLDAAFKGLNLMAEILYPRRLPDDPLYNPEIPYLDPTVKTIYYCTSCYGAAYGDCAAEDSKTLKTLIMSQAAIECFKNCIKTDEKDNPVFNKYKEAPDIEAKGFMITPKGKICWPSDGIGKDERGSRAYWVLELNPKSDYMMQGPKGVPVSVPYREQRLSLIKYFNKKLPPEEQITEFAKDDKKAKEQVMTAWIEHCRMKTRQVDQQPT